MLTFTATCMDVEGIMVCEISLIEKNKYHMMLLYVISENKKKINKHAKKADSNLSIQRTIWLFPEGKGWEWWTMGIASYMLPVMEWMTHGNKSHSVGNIVNGIIVAFYGDRW